MASPFWFPNPVNEKAARVVAGGVALWTIATLLLPALSGVHAWWWLSVPLAVGFALRVGWGPQFDPLGRFATKVAAPRLGNPVFVPGPPKRFAQTIGLAFSSSAAILALGFGYDLPATIVLGVLAAFAILESVFNFCAGCFVFGLLMRANIIPTSVCEACADVTRRSGQAGTSAASPSSAPGPPAPSTL